MPLNPVSTPFPPYFLMLIRDLPRTRGTLNFLLCTVPALVVQFYKRITNVGTVECVFETHDPWLPYPLIQTLPGGCPTRAATPAPASVLSPRSSLVPRSLLVSSRRSSLPPSLLPRSSLPRLLRARAVVRMLRGIFGVAECALTRCAHRSFFCSFSCTGVIGFAPRRPTASSRRFSYSASESDSWRGSLCPCGARWCVQGGEACTFTVLV